MINFSLKKMADINFINSITKFFKKIGRRFFPNLDLDEEKKDHLQNAGILIFSYTVVSLLLYPKFSFITYLKELFALICSYAAIFIWFVEETTPQTQHRIAIGVTACISPIFFINNTISVALVEIFLIIFLEFVFFEHLKGVRLFSKEVPIYIICSDISEVEIAQKFTNKYKVLELILLSKNKKEKIHGISTLSSVESIKNWLQKIRRIPFFPIPRRFIYLSSKLDSGLLKQFLEISSQFSIPFFKGVVNDGNLNVVPVSLYDFENISISPQEKTQLSGAFKGKRVWVTYDGRGSCIDLICALEISVPSIDLTILCESEKLANEIDRELNQRYYNKNHRIRVMDLNLMCQQTIRPDILFYNLPIKSFSSRDDNLKEAVIKNVLDTEKLISFAQQIKIPSVFVFSSLEALNSNNWVGATQRLAELLLQFADSKSRKLYTKFKVIRIPETPTDVLGLANKITSSILSNGYVNIDLSETEIQQMYHRKELISPLIKSIVQSLKEHDPFHSVLTLLPENGIDVKELIQMICSVFCLRMECDIKIANHRNSETMDLENFPNISETLEKSGIPDVFCTKFTTTSAESYNFNWNIEQINAMSTRDLISAVFQSLSEKIKN